ncbi:MAG: DNA polymerase III subunit gamma/tau, partial [Paracoccaceae bacterium]
DATSLLDQAISHGAGETTAVQVRAMLGLADRGRVLDLFDLVMKGDAAGALTELSAQYADGADPMAVLRDLAEITHWISVVQITPSALEDPTVSPDERARGQDMATRLPMRVLGRAWQMLLKALEEVALAPNAMMAAEMALIRLTHVSDLPDPATLIRRVQEGDGGSRGMAAAPAAAPTGPVMARPSMPVADRHTPGPVAQASVQPMPDAQMLALRFPDFSAVVELVRAQRDMKLLMEIETHLRLVHYAPGRIEFQPAQDAPSDLASRLGQRLQGWSGARWGVSVVGAGGGSTIAETRQAQDDTARAQARLNPLVQAVMQAFPDAKIVEIRPLTPAVAEAATTALPEVDEEWDPFEED